jgi:hypothetical protein
VRPRAFAAHESAHDEGGFDHRGGFVEMDELEFVRCGVGFFLGEQVFHLSADEAAAAGGVREFADESVGEGGVRVHSSRRGGRRRA